MSLVETLVGVVAGSVLGFASSVMAQNFFLRGQKTEMVNERVYSPLYDEMAEAVERLKRNEGLSTEEWDRVSKKDHLTYLIDGKLREDLRRFYGPTLNRLDTTANTCTNHYPPLVTADVNNRLQDRSTPTTSGDVMTMWQAVGWNLHRGSIREHQIVSYSQAYDRLRAFSSGFTHETLAEYFDWWKEKSRDDKQLVEYREAREKALSEAESLCNMLGGKLGVESGTEETKRLHRSSRLRRYRFLFDSFVLLLGVVLVKSLFIPVSFWPQIYAVTLSSTAVLGIVLILYRKTWFYALLNYIAESEVWVVGLAATLFLEVAVTVLLISPNWAGWTLLVATFLPVTGLVWAGDLLKTSTRKLSHSSTGPGQLECSAPIHSLLPEEFTGVLLKGFDVNKGRHGVRESEIGV